MKIEPKVFDMKNGKRPKVLIVGNGLLMNEQNGNWSEIIKKLSEKERISEAKNLPYSLLSTINLSALDKDREDKYFSYFNHSNKDDDVFYYYEHNIGNEHNILLNNLVSLPFDAILTTNYTYEIENSLCEQFSGLSKNSKAKYSYTISRSGYTPMNRRFNLCRFNKVGGKDIWHIHGEARLKSSIVLTHDEYSRYIATIVDYNKQNKNRYKDTENAVEFYSWIDYLLLGDIYCIGFGFDFSEFDLWWVLNRRQRENQVAIGNFVFYDCLNILKEPSQLEKHSVLTQLGVTCNTCDCSVNVSCGHDEQNAQYNKFYEKAIKDIQQTLEETI